MLYVIYWCDTSASLLAGLFCTPVGLFCTSVGLFCYAVMLYTGVIPVLACLLSRMNMKCHVIYWCDTSASLLVPILSYLYSPYYVTYWCAIEQDEYETTAIEQDEYEISCYVLV